MVIYELSQAEDNGGKSGQVRMSTNNALPEKPHAADNSLCPSVRATCVRLPRGPPSVYIYMYI